MISKELKNLIETSGGRYILVENGKPCCVVIGWDEYKKCFAVKKPIKTLTEEELIAKINSDISIWRENNQEADEALKNEIEKLEDIEYI